MSTKYSVVIDRFLIKIEEDKDYFSYGGNLSDENVMDLINKRSKNILIESISELQRKKAINQQVNFLDKDDETEEFNFDLIDSEIDLIGELMVVKYFDRGLAELRAKQKYLGKDITVFSPNAERKTYLEMVQYKHSLFESSLSDYNSIDRNSGEYLLAY